MTTSDSANENPYGMRRSRDSYGNAYIKIHAKFAVASGATHMRTTEYVDTDDASRDYYDNIR